MAPKLSALRSAGSSAGIAKAMPAAPAGAGDMVGRGTKRSLRDLTPAGGDGVGRKDNTLRPANAPIDIVVFRYGDRANDHMSAWPPNARVFQIQMLHEGSPSYVVNIIPPVNGYLQSLHAEDQHAPKSLADLRKQCNIVVQITRPDGNNDSDLQLIHWRVAFYIVGNRDALNETLRLLHGYIKHRALHPLASDRRAFAELDEQEMTVHFGPRVECFQFDDQQQPVVKSHNVTQMSDAPWTIFDCAGPAGNKFLFMELEAVDDTHVALGWTGRAWGMRESFDMANIQLAEDGAGGFVRFVNGEDGNVAEETVVQKLIDIISDSVLHRCPCLVLVANPQAVTDGAPVEQFMAQLRQMDHLHFLPSN